MGDFTLGAWRLFTAQLLRWLEAFSKAAERAPHSAARRAFGLGGASMLMAAAAGCASMGAPPPPPAPPPPMPPPPPPMPPPITRSSEGQLPSFPWPPPQPSTQVPIRRERFGGDTTFTNLADRLKIALNASGHARMSYYSAPGGFAMVTRLERLRDDARPAAENRFAPPQPGQAETEDFLAFVQSLWFAPTGYYRQIVFITTDQPFTASAPPLSVEDAAELLQDGLPRLPPAYGARAFTPRHRVEALIYEFAKEGEAQAEVRHPARWTGNTHLTRLGLLNYLPIRPAL